MKDLLIALALICLTIVVIVMFQNLNDTPWYVPLLTVSVTLVAWSALLKDSED